MPATVIALPVTSGRFTVAELLRGLDAHGVPEGAAADPELDELLGWFRAECARRVAACPTEAVPLRLPKGRVTQLLACERGTIANLGDSGLTEPIVRGRLVDLMVGQHVSGGLGPDAAAVEADLLDAIAAADDRALAGWLAAADAGARARVWGHVSAAADSVRSSWGEVPRGWWPRVQEQVSVDVADGALVLAARFDVALGGPPTGRPLVIVEVKAGAGADRHRQDLLWYGLVAALRHGRMPAVVATWTAADDALVPVPVTVGSLEAAARRGLTALERLVALVEGEVPRATPFVGCAWCADRERCPQGSRWLAAHRGVVAGEAEWDPEGGDGS